MGQDNTPPACQNLHDKWRLLDPTFDGLLLARPAPEKVKYFEQWWEERAVHACNGTARICLAGIAGCGCGLFRGVSAVCWLWDAFCLCLLLRWGCNPSPAPALVSGGSARESLEDFIRYISAGPPAGSAQLAPLIHLRCPSQIAGRIGPGGIEQCRMEDRQGNMGFCTPFGGV